MNSGESDSTELSNTEHIEVEDKNFIDRILGEMKSEFNKTEKSTSEEVTEIPVMDPSLSNDVEEDIATVKTEESTKEIKEEEVHDSPETTEEVDKPRIILSFKKPNSDPSVKNKEQKEKKPVKQKNSLDEKIDESGLKRSARRRSKDCNESVLQSAIARKEKSYNESNKPQRLTRQLKPTQKILENLALAKQEKNKAEKTKKVNETETDLTKNHENERFHRKHKHKHHHNKHSKKAKRMKSDSSRDSDSDQSLQESFRRSRRISSRDDSNTDMDEQSGQDSFINDENVPFPKNASDLDGEEEGNVSPICLCTQKTAFYLLLNNNEDTFCSAVDSVGDKLVGCSRIIDSKEVMLMRPSTRIPYTYFCEAHKNRLLRHNCCPACGIFCTQGRFVECEHKHHYHKGCQKMTGGVECCPHCGTSTMSYDVDITMHSEKRPIFLPVQKAQYVSARMTFPCSYKSEDVKCVTPPLVPIGALDMQNSLQYGDEEYEITDLIAAIKDNAVDRVALILGSKSVDVNCKIPECNDGTVLHLAAQKSDVTIVHMLLVSGTLTDVLDKDQNTPLMVAVTSTNNDVVQYLIKTGAKVDLKGTDGMTALHLAAKCGNLKACELLLKASNSVRNFVNIQDDGGWTPLVWACEHGYADVADFLIHKSADPSLRDVEHNIALHWAAFSGSSHIAELLLNKGSDVNATNAHGDTPLHIGARQDMYNCNMVLLARGADVTLLNKNSESPLDCVPPGGDSYSPIALNISLQATVDYRCTNVLLCNDISKGKEVNPIQCYNNVDSEPKPTDFRYVTKNCITSDDVKVDNKINSLQYCQCEERCVDDNCHCGKLSVRCWYDEEGKLVPEFSFTDIPMIFECNDRCSCNAITCNNRVVQKGLSQRFELFKTVDKGWGIRTLRHIPKGSFVCEYVGEIITDLEADRREDDSFVFDLENRVCKNESDVDTYCIDAKFYGNFARFINHSCSPNLTSVKVFVEHQDLKFPRIAFFANRDIELEEELGFDYGEKFWIAKYKSLFCCCGSLQCKYSEDVFELTMQNHQRSLEECG